MTRVGGRVHALVRPTHSAGVKPPAFAARRIQSVLTPGITRPPATLRLITAGVSRVGCMPLLDCGFWGKRDLSLDFRGDPVDAIMADPAVDPAPIVPD